MPTVSNYSQQAINAHYRTPTRNTDPREKWREGHKCIWNMVLEKNVINKLNRQNKEWWSFWEGERRKITFKIFKNRHHSWIGHIIRHNEFVVKILEGAISRKKSVGRPQLQYLKQLNRNTAADSYTATKRMACNSTRWKAANQSKDWRIRRKTHALSTKDYV